MAKEYKEEDLLLVLNYDTNHLKILNFYERCKIHQWANCLHRCDIPNISEEIKAKVASILTEINHTNYKTKKSHYIENENSKPILIKDN